jgi:hypothetical protein
MILLLTASGERLQAGCERKHDLTIKKQTATVEVSIVSGER